MESTGKTQWQRSLPACRMSFEEPLQCKVCRDGSGDIVKQSRVEGASTNAGTVGSLLPERSDERCDIRHCQTGAAQTVTTMVTTLLMTCSRIGGQSERDQAASQPNSSPSTKICAVANSPNSNSDVMK